MTDKQYNAIVNGIDILVATAVEILKVLSKDKKTTIKKKPTSRVFEKPNKAKSLTVQEYYKVSDLIKAFVREKPDLIDSMTIEDDEQAPEYPIVDSHDDIVDIEEKIEDKQAELLSAKNAQTQSFSQSEANDEKNPKKNDESKVEEKLSEVDKLI